MIPPGLLLCVSWRFGSHGLGCWGNTAWLDCAFMTANCGPYTNDNAAVAVNPGPGKPALAPASAFLPAIAAGPQQPAITQRYCC